jgi:hypothetical protein
LDWKKEIAIAYLVKQEVMKVDVEGLWQHHLPETAATEQEIEDLEKSMGEDLDISYREFLKFANGWQGFFQSIDLFGLSELKGNAMSQRADQLLLALGDTKDLFGTERQDLLPIAASRDSIDLVVIEKKKSTAIGKVHWLAGDLIDSFSSFEEFFLAMVDYNREEISALK